MKIIPDQKITSASADSSASGYPASNALDEHPKKIWKANSTNTGTLTLDIDPHTSGIAIFNTNALSLTVTVEDANAIDWFTSDADWFTSDADWSSADAILINEIYSLDGISGAAWIEYPLASIALSATIAFTAASQNTVYCGVVVADKVREFACPQIGVNEGLRSYAITRELQNGAFYRKQRDTVRTFGFEIIEDRSEDFYKFMYEVAREIDWKPAAWRLTEIEADGFWWVVYARFQQMPSGAHNLPDYSQININLIEVL